MPITKPNRGAADLPAQVDEVLAIAEEVECGFADQPVTAALRWSHQELQSGPLGVAVLSLDGAARETALSWLTGSTATALRLSDRVVSIVNCNTQQTDDFESPFNVANARRSELENTQVTVAPVADVLANDARLLLPFWARADILVITWTGPLAEHPVERIEFCASLLDEFAGIGVLQCETAENQSVPGFTAVKEDPDNASAASRFLRRIANHSGVLWRINLARPKPMRACEAIPPMGASLRHALQAYRTAGTLRAATDTLGHRAAARSVQLSRELELLGRQKKLAGRRGRTKKPLAEVRYRVACGFTTLQNSMISKSAQALQPLGELSQLMQEVISELDVSTLEVETTANSVSYRLDASHFSRIGRRVSEKLQVDLEKGIRELNADVAVLINEAEQRVSGLFSERRPLTRVELAWEPIWDSIRNSLQIGKDSQIDLPRRGLVDLLTAGRQKVFILVMLTGLAGRIGFSKDVLEPLGLDKYSGPLSAGFTLLAVTVFIGSILDAILRWRREADAQAAKEMQKIKETLYTDGMKLCDQAQKAKLNAVKEYLKETAKHVDRQLEEAESEFAEQAQLEEDEAKEQLETAIKRTEQERKKADEVHKKLEKLSGQVVAAVAAAEKTLRTVVAGKPPDDTEVQVGGIRARPKGTPTQPNHRVSRAAVSTKSGQASKRGAVVKSVGSKSASADRLKRLRAIRSVKSVARGDKTNDRPANEGTADLKQSLAEKRSAKPSQKTTVNRASVADRLAARKAQKKSSADYTTDSGKKLSLASRLATRSSDERPKIATPARLGKKQGDSSTERPQANVLKKKKILKKKKSVSELPAASKSKSEAEKKPSLAARLAARKAAHSSDVAADQKPGTDKLGVKERLAKRSAASTKKKSDGLAQRLATRKPREETND